MHLRKLGFPCALFVSHDALARGVLGSLAMAGVTVPEEVAVLGVDNDEFECTLTEPYLSSINVPFDAMGREAARHLDRLMKSRNPPVRSALIQPTGVVERQSTDIIAVDDPRLREAARYIREHACNGCTVDDVAAAIGASRGWVHAEFKKRFNRTPHHEINRVRMDLARHLLRSTQLPIREVALQCGFSLVHNFGRTFRNTIQQTPAAYRRRHQISR